MNEDVKIPNDSEISQILQEFEKKSAVEQTPSKASKNSTIPETSKMVQLVMKLSGGTIKEQKTAEYFLLGLVIIFFAVSFYLFFGRGETIKKLTPEQQRAIDNANEQMQIRKSI